MAELRERRWSKEEEGRYNGVSCLFGFPMEPPPGDPGATEVGSPVKTVKRARTSTAGSSNTAVEETPGSPVIPRPSFRDQFTGFWSQGTETTDL
ncbi:hypothetical protein LINPERPRIM_LOCUS17402, partial [Linum perenne]